MTRTARRISSPVIAAFLVLLLGSTATIWSWKNDVDQGREKTEATLDKRLDALVESSLNQLVLYLEALRGLGAYASNEDLTYQKMKSYVKTLDASTRFSSTSSFAYAEVVKAQDKTAFEQRLRGEGFTDYTIHPPSTRDQYIPITYVVSFKNEKIKTLGFDYLSDKDRNRLVTQGRDSGQPVISDIIVLLNDKGKTNQPSIIMMVPVFSGPTTTLQERRSSIKGYVYLALRIRTFLDNVQSTENSDVQLSMYKGKHVDKSQLIYGNYVKENGSRETVKRSFPVNDKYFTIQGTATKSLASEADRGKSDLLLFLGLVLTALLSSFLLFAMKARTREIEYHKQMDLKNAKDDLLSLASHQLRTPATGVKQYVGMVLEGYAGNITDEQREMLAKANESNERQLSIINQILRLSRMEAQRVVLRKEAVDIVDMVNDIVRELSTTLAQRNVSVNTDDKEVTARVDPSYFRMVIENLITNAAKYSHDGDSISISVSHNPSELMISVRDTGIGIALEDFDKLFTLFSRIDNELSMTVSGTGIGLYVDKIIVDLHGGTIDVDSRVGQGSTFTVTIPNDNESQEIGSI